MATASRKQPSSEAETWRISLQANDLLECFVSGLDDLILKIALSRAAKRNAGSGQPVSLTATDIQDAANDVYDRIVSDSKFSEDLKDDLRQARECMDQKCSRLAR